MRSGAARLAALVSLFFLCADSTAQTRPSSSGDGKVVPGRLLIQLNESAAAQVQGNNPSFSGMPGLNALGGDYGLSGIEAPFLGVADPALARETGLDRWFVLSVDPGTDLFEAAGKYMSLPEVENAEPDQYGEYTIVPNDPVYPQQWGHRNTGQLPAHDGASHAGPGVGNVGFDSCVEDAWNYLGHYGDVSVIIAIIDSGVDLDHPDLNLVAGYDFGAQDSNPDDELGHGTACAGVAAAIADNGQGVAGVAGGCRIMPLKVSTGTGGPISSAIASAIVYAADNGADVISMSLGGGYSGLTESSAAYAYSRGVTLLAATGNNNAAVVNYPASSPWVIAVGAAAPCGGRKRSSASGSEVSPGVQIDPNDYTCDGERWWGSNYGIDYPGASSAVDVLAPTILPTTDIRGAAGADPGDYALYFNGTSCATPYAAGVAALILSAYPGWSPSEVRNQLRRTARDVQNVESGEGWDRYSGYGLVNAHLAVSTEPCREPIVNGNIKVLDAPPNKANAKTDGLDIWMFKERTNWPLPQGVLADARNPGTYDSKSDLGVAELLKGWPVTTYYLHFNPKRGENTSFGVITFCHDICGIEVKDGTLRTNSKIVGLPEVSYPGFLSDRGYELNGKDQFIIGADRRTLTVDVKEWLGMDDMRVYVDCPGGAGGGGCLEPTAQFSIPTAVCYGAPINFAGSASFLETSYSLECRKVKVKGGHGEWVGSDSYSATGTVGSMDLTSVFPKLANPGIYRIALTVENSCGSDTRYRWVCRGTPLGISLPPGPLSLCNGPIELLPTVTGGTPPYTIFWGRSAFFPQLSFSLGEGASLVVSESGFYMAYVVDALGCVANAPLVEIQGATSCVPPPSDMVGWWTLDESAGSTAAEISTFSTSSYPGTHIASPVPTTGAVGNALEFDGSNCVSVKHHNRFNIHTTRPVISSPGQEPFSGDFSIDAWIRPDEYPSWRSAIVSKGVPCFDTENAEYAYYHFSLTSGGGLAFELHMNSGAHAAFATPPGSQVALGAWTHVAVTLDRDDPSGVSFYINGIEVAAPGDPTPHTGGVSTKGPFLIGQYCDLNTDGGFVGAIDEVEVFQRALDPVELWDLYEAGGCNRGKCRQFVVGGDEVVICPGGTAKTFKVYACNYSDSPQTYDLAVEGLDAGVYSDIGATDVDGPVVISVNPSQITLGPGECKELAVSLDKPVELDESHERAGYELTMTNQQTADVFTRRGVIVSRYALWCPVVVSCSGCLVGPAGGMPGIEVGSTATVDFLIDNVTALPQTLDYCVVATDVDGAATPVLSIDGGAPGDTLCGTVSVASGSSGLVAVSLQFLTSAPHDPTTVSVLVDEDGTGAYTRLSSFVVRSLGIDDSADTTSTVIGGRVFNDENGNGEWDSTESPLSTLTVTLVQSGSVVDSVATDAGGGYEFPGLAPGTYRVLLTPPAGWVPTAPLSVIYTVVLAEGDVVPGLDFGLFQECGGTSTAQYTVGLDDGFDTQNGSELLTPSPALESTCGSGTFAPALDVCGQDRCLAHTFTALMPDTSCVAVAATLTIRVKACGGLSSTDAINLWNDTDALWSFRLSDLRQTLNGEPNSWGSGDESLFVLDLASLPADPGRQVTNVLAALQDNAFDVRVADDSAVDFIRLDVTFCCPGGPLPETGPPSWAGTQPVLELSSAVVRGATRVAFQLDAPGEVLMQVFDVSGRLVSDLLDEYMPAGRHERTWVPRSRSGGGLPDGVYFMRLVTAQGSHVQRAVVLK